MRVAHEGAAVLGAQAPGDDDLAVFRQRLADRIQRLRDGRVDEAARVDDDQVGAVVGGGDRVPLGAQLRQDLLGIDQCLGAAERDEADARRDIRGSAPWPAGSLVGRHLGTGFTGSGARSIPEGLRDGAGADGTVRRADRQAAARGRRVQAATASALRPAVTSSSKSAIVDLGSVPRIHGHVLDYGDGVRARERGLRRDSVERPGSCRVPQVRSPGAFGRRAAGRRRALLQARRPARPRSATRGSWRGRVVCGSRNGRSAKDVRSSQGNRHRRCGASAGAPTSIPASRLPVPPR